MSFLGITKCADVTISNGGTTSNVVKAREVFQDADTITLFAPAVLDAVTFTIEGTDDPDAAAPTWTTLYDGANDVLPPPAGKHSVYACPTFQGFRIKASGPVAADRTWRMSKAFKY